MVTYRKQYKRRQPTRKLGKRWYVNATLPRSVPFVGGSSFRAGSGLAKRQVARIARREINRREETKQHVFWQYITSLSNNTMYAMAPLNYIAEGVDDSQRTGRKVFARHIRIQGSLENNVPTYVRVLALWTEKLGTWTGSNVSLVGTSGIGSSDLFLAGAANLTYAMLNNKLGNKLVCDKVFKILPDISGQKKMNKFVIECPLMTNIQYNKATVPSDLNEKQFVVCVLPFEPGIASGAVSTLAMNLQGIVTFKDS